MAKKRVQAYMTLATTNWMDRQISKDVFASYSHVINFAVKQLRKDMAASEKAEKWVIGKNAGNEK